MGSGDDDASCAFGDAPTSPPSLPVPVELLHGVVVTSPPSPGDHVDHPHGPLDAPGASPCLHVEDPPAPNVPFPLLPPAALIARASWRDLLAQRCIFLSLSAQLHLMRSGNRFVPGATRPISVTLPRQAMLIPVHMLRHAGSGTSRASPPFASNAGTAAYDPWSSNSPVGNPEEVAVANLAQELARMEKAPPLECHASPDPAHATCAAPLAGADRAVHGAPDLGSDDHEHVAHGHHCLTAHPSLPAPRSCAQLQPRPFHSVRPPPPPWWTALVPALPLPPRSSTCTHPSRLSLPCRPSSAP